MAKTCQLVMLSLLSFSAFISVMAEHQPFMSNASLKGKKQTHLRFFWHDTLSGSNPTSITVAKPSNANTSAVFDFGFVNVFDNPITEGPELESKLLGRSQGFYTDASQNTEPFQVLFSSLNFAFTEGKYNGSTVTVLGRNPILSTVREMPLIGGSGVFRFAEGYALLHTHRFNPQTRDAIVEYNIYVWHY
ncbi:hypothetical protein L6164_002418 [Bauhinia variegata]|uniref:Uncharacterized protein n=1 Tax=Bauhinia variegata TaxID=167791 RepID=A0ACB9PXL9_BAUVA|nr:hypothetical protein L6164_002418 [Bauhinia variegata]